VVAMAWQILTSGHEPIAKTGGGIR
jgi:hypothetical protein